jgi:gas vesicle protein
MNEIIQLAGFNDTQLSATDAARAERDHLLALAATITSCASREEADNVADVLRSLKKFTTQIESARSEVKAPVLDLGKRIDSLAKDLVTSLEFQATRLSRTLGAWQSEQNRIAAEIQRKARDDEDRIKAEANRKIAEAQEASKTQATFERRADRIEEKAVAQIIKTRVAAAAAAPQKPAGMATRPEICFEVVDIIALHGAAPYLVVMTPNTAALKQALKGLQPGQSLPGVRHWVEAKTFVR